MRIKTTSTLLIIFLCAIVNAQIKRDSLKDLSLPGLAFRSLGPAFTGGRVVDIAVNPQNKSEYYVVPAKIIIRTM